MHTYKTLLVTLVFAVAIMCVGYIGCNKDSDLATRFDVSDNTGQRLIPLFSGDVSTAHYDVLSVDYDKHKMEAEVHMSVVLFDASEPEIRDLRFSVIDDKSREGFRATLESDSGTLLWETGQCVDKSNRLHVWTWEKTSSDSLTIEQFTTDSSFTEIYTINGQTRPFHFSTNDRSAIRALKSSVGRDGGGGAQSVLPGSDKNLIVSQLEEFKAFYPNQNSLNGNSNGYFVFDLLTDTSFARAVGSAILEEGDPEGNDGPFVLQMPDWCHFALICVELKCPEAINPLCTPCVGLVVYCVIKEIFSML